MAEFQAAGVRGRLVLLKLLEKVAFFQPERILALVGWAITNPTAVVEEIDHPLAHLYPSDYIEVLKELPSLLENVGYNLAHLPAVVDVLWDLARHDTRPTNQYPDHPMRVLSELAAYGVAKPVEFQEILVDAVARWLERDDLTEWPYSPLEVIKPLLAPEVEIRRSDGLSITLQSVPVRVEVVKGLRERVLAIAFAQAHSDDPKRAVEGVATIETSITYPHGLFGRTVSDEERDRWTPLLVDTIERLGLLAAEEDLDPAVSVAVGRALQWHAQHSPTETRTAAQLALSHVSDSIDRRLAQVLYDGWGHAVAYTGDIEDFERQRQAQLDEVAAAAADRWSTEETVDHLAERMLANRRAYGASAGQPGPFVWTLVHNNPAIGDAICHRVIEEPTSILRQLVPVVLGRLADTSPSTALTHAHELLATGDIAVQRGVAQAFGSGRGNRATLVDGEADLLRALVQNNDIVVRRLATAAAPTLARSRHPLALELVMTVQFTDSEDIAEEIAAAFGPGCLSWMDLSPAQADNLLGRLHACPRIDGYQVNTLLGVISSINPEAVLDLLKGRVEAHEQIGSPASYEPLPHMWYNRLRFRDTTQFIQSLRSTIGWMAEGVDSWYRQREGAEIFATIAESFDDQVIQTLTEAIETGNKQQIQAAGSILRKTSQELECQAAASVRWCDQAVASS